ncbi:PTS system trehalose-specific EIIBC component [Alkalicoccobacillus plakortidis]|uniref:PTS system trehalose-specific EIIBC component n=1 Tax=Alkalicoccobacillus plakortidis TaxID=444060 RepID=A0ABT0XM58_9BACI|nr:PTS system trehalose-specific EIIBC component [Alkalicoccobacillus plakortidis]MCM2676810.1 PTS system trehalose-specific EIIBC component [Alkalicoccobacillus plakortidis]
MSDNRKTAKEILEAIGGKENISSATHCVTRLRLVLHDESKVDKETLENIDPVKGSFSANNQFQVILGQGLVDKVYAEFISEAGISESSKEETKEESTKKMNPLQKAVKGLSDIFIPILPAIITAGLLLGLNNVLTNAIFTDQPIIDMYPQWAGLAEIINTIASTAFVFLPALIGWSAVRKFGGSPLLGIVLGLILCHPGLLNANDYAGAVEDGTLPFWNLFGFDIAAMGYQGQVLPVLLASYVLAKIENFMKKITPDSFQLLVVAPVALLITGFLAFILIGPVTFALGNSITGVFVSLFDQFAIVGGAVYGLFYAPLVITGMHHTFLAVDFQLIASQGGTFLWPILVMSNVAQGSAALAMYFILKNQKMKGLSLTSSISAYLGITEPALFGVNLRYRFPFICAIIGASIAGAWVAVNGIVATVGVGGLPGIVSIVGERPDYINFAIGMVIAIVIPVVATIIASRFQKDFQDR